MASTAGAAGDRDIEFDQLPFVSAVAATINEHTSTAATGVVGSELACIAEGIDPLSAHIAAAMSGWGGERLLGMTNVAKQASHLESATTTTVNGFNAEDHENSAMINAIASPL